MPKGLHSIATLFSAIALMLCGCISNDIPYARIQPNFTSLQAEGQDAGTLIDTVARTVTLTLPEEVDIYNVAITEYSITEGSEIVDNPLTAPIDLSSPLTVVLRLYQDYSWKIIGNQTIERYFEVAGQMGESVIDVPGSRVLLTVNASSDLSALTIVRAKLGPAGASYSPSLAEGATFDGRSPLSVVVEAYGRAQTWTIYVQTMDVSVRTVSADAWTCVAWINCQGEAGKDNGVEYRLASDTEWLKVDKAAVSQNGGNFTARIDHLSPGATYTARAYSGTDYGEEISFTTGAVVQPPNMDFDNWWLDGKIWCPWAEGADAYWGTGNQGAVTLGTSNTTPTEDTPSGSGWAARLESRFVGIGALGKLAAGNLFVGSYVRTVGTNGVLSFGRTFKERPTGLKGMFKYHSATIDRASDEFRQLAGRPDTCIVWVALIDTDEPLEIRTAPNDRQLFDPAADYVVAYGRMQSGESVENWTPFIFNLEYKSTSRVPKYILITCSASKYGDYFTGGSGSVLTLDDFELTYDY